MYATTPDEATNQVVIIVVTTALIFLCYSLYFLRIVSRKVMDTPLWADDWFMLACLMVCTMMSVLNYVGIAFGSGVHRSHMPPDVYRSFQINLYVFMMSWALGVTVVKIGILLFYYRVFSVAQFRRTVMILGAAITLSGTAIFMAFMLQCLPIPRFWADTTDGYCINQVDFYISGGSLNIIGDVLVLSLPIRRVWGLKASVSQRLALVLLFALGGFVCITSIFRLTALNEINPDDFSYTNVAGGLWSTVEVQVGFICANLPHTRTLFLRWFRRGAASSQSYGSSQSQGRSGTGGSAAHAGVRRGTSRGGFQELGPHGRPHPTQAFVKSSEVESGSGNSDTELSEVAPWEAGAGNAGIAVRTDMVLEVQDQDRAGAARPKPSETAWNDPVSTHITARGRQ